MVLRWVGIPLFGLAMLVAYGWALFEFSTLLLGRDPIYSLTIAGNAMVVMGLLVPLIPLSLALLPLRRQGHDEDRLVKVLVALAIGTVLSIVFVLFVGSLMIFG